MQQKKPASSTISYPGRKAKLAQDRAYRAQRRSGKDLSILSPPLSETSESMEAMNKSEKKDEGSEKAEVTTEDINKSSRKRQRRDSDISQEAKRPKIEE